MSLEQLTPRLRDQLGLNGGVKGVYVAQVTADSAAAESGVQSGDVILGIGEQTVSTPAQVAAAIHAAERAKKSALALFVMREGTRSYLALQLT